MSNDKLQQVYQRNVIETTQIIQRLTERNRQLEQFIKDWVRHTQGEEVPYSALQERAKALLAQEVK